MRDAPRTTLVAGIGFSTLVTLRARGWSPRTLLPLGTALGAVCGLLVTSALAGFARPPKPWVLGAALNGATWGLLIARHALTDRRGRRASG